MNFFLVFIGGGIGSATRYLISIMFTKVGIHSAFATICVNVVGCFLIALASSCISRYYQSFSSVQLFVITGFLGGFTTFSTFMLDIHKLNTFNSITYLIFSVVLGLIAFYIGLFISSKV